MGPPSVRRYFDVMRYLVTASVFAALICGYASSSANSPEVSNNAPSDYVDGRSCAQCHLGLYKTYSQTGMGRSFDIPKPETTVEDYQQKNSYYHSASDTHFQMIERNGRYYQRRFQIGFKGQEANVEEKLIDYVMGSGNHARTYLHRTSSGTLEELPLAWYSENGGHWGMNPGYDKPDQLDSLRAITYDCMFCHNAYPSVPTGHDQLRSEAVFGATLPEGIDCQRCHGPGRKHVEAAQSPKPSLATIRSTILNPARLPPARQMEVCMQCHLETTSAPFPHAIVKYDRGAFDYRPDEPLSGFMLSFDHATEKEDRFQIVNSVYRLRMSQCFLRSKGTLQCTTCHDPHNVTHDASATQHYNTTCTQCHGESFRQEVERGLHTSAGNCIDCHMPKRRTQDVVHAVMTDHYIQRPQKDRDLLAEIPEPHAPETLYRGPVVPYYPNPLEGTPQNDLYLALAQVREENNLSNGAIEFAALVEKYKPPQANFYIELADALVKLHQSSAAIADYRSALEREPNSLAAWLGLGAAYEQAGQPASAESAYQRCATLYPADPRCWDGIAGAYMGEEKTGDAITALQKSLELNAEIPEAFNLLGQLQFQGRGDLAGAEHSYREAIRLWPNFLQARVSLAVLLFQTKRPEEAEYNFRYALRFKPDYALAHFDYGLMLKSTGRIEEAIDQLQAAVNSDRNYAEAFEVLGQIAEMRGDLRTSIANYSEAVRIRPGSEETQLELGSVLARAGERNEAVEHLRRALASSNTRIRQNAAAILSDIDK